MSSPKRSEPSEAVAERSDATVATATEEEAPLCYICYEEEETNLNPFMSEDVCDCRGSMKVHQICYELVRGLDNRCKTCRSIMRQPHAMDARWQVTYDVKQKIIATLRDGPVIEMVAGTGGTGMYYIRKRACYKDGQLDGAQALFNESGEELGVNNYRAGQKHGVCFEKLVLEMNAIFVVLNNCSEYYRHYNPVALTVAVKLGGEFVLGLRTGVHVSAGPWSRHETMWSVVEATYAADQKHGPEREYLAHQYEGEERRTCRELGWRAGLQHGWERKYETRYDNHYLYEETHWRDGQLDGPSRSYYVEVDAATAATVAPMLKEEAHYFEGQLDGSQTKYSLCGGKHYMSELKSWRGGVLEGAQMTHWEYEDGDGCSAYGTVRGGMKDGMFAEVTDDSINRYLVKNYKDGLLDGAVVDVIYSNTCAKDDVVVSEASYRKGKKHGRQLLNVIAGTELQQSVIADDNLLASTFRAADLNFYEGRIHGKNTVYYADGKEICSGTFTKGVPVGRHYLLRMEDTGRWMEEVGYDKKGRLHGLCYYRTRHIEQLTCRLSYEHGRMAGRQVVYGQGNIEAFSWTVDRADKEGKRLKGAVQWFNERGEMTEERYVRAHEELCVEDFLEEPILIRKPAVVKLEFDEESNMPSFMINEVKEYIYPRGPTEAAAVAPGGQGVCQCIHCCMVAMYIIANNNDSDGIYYYRRRRDSW